MTQNAASAPVVLVVDDDHTFRLLAREALEVEGLTVLDAMDGVEAAALFLKNRIDLLIVDALMPRMDGFALCQLLRGRPETQYLPILMVTGLEDISSVDQAYKAGATDFIVKPLNWMILCQRVRYMLRASAALDDVRTAKDATETAYRQLNLLEQIATTANQSQSIDDVFAFTLDEVCRYMNWAVGHVYLATSGEAGLVLKSSKNWVERDPSRTAAFRDGTGEAAAGADVGPAGRVAASGTALWIDDIAAYSDNPRIAVAARCGLRSAAVFPVLVGSAVVAVFEVFADQPRPVDASLLRLMAQVGAQLTPLIERSRAEERLYHQATHDALTGLPNRVLFLSYLRQALERARREAAHRFAIIFIDLDQFKVVNDSLGHQAGDALLVDVGNRLSKLLGVAGEVVARLGGDEFTVFIDNLRDTQDAIRVAERIQEALAAPFTVAGQELYTAASIGISIGGDNYTSSEEVLRDADIAMYHAKSLGKGRHAMFDQAMHAAAIKRLALENDLRRAVQNGEFMVYYQPIVALDTERTSGFEALVRWQRPGTGLVPPDEFIGLAEETGLIVPMGQWVLRESCRQIRQWQRELPALGKLTISVNLSARQFDHPLLVQEIKDALEQTGLDPSCLRLEITESITMSDVAHTIDILRQLKAIGVQFSLDDFGTGYSSLSLLHRLPFDVLKIDRSFVRSIDSNEESRSIAQTIMSLAQSMRLRVVAEGTERAEQTAVLRGLGCDFAQGYQFSRPIDAKTATVYLAAGLQAASGSTLKVAATT